MNATDEQQRWQRRAARERQARIEAETIAEQATSELYASNIELDAANQRLTRTEAFYRELFAHNPLPLYVVDRQSLAFLEVNDTAQQHYGFDRAEFLALTLRDIEPVTELDAADRRRAALDPAEPATGLWHHVTRAGLFLDMELSIHTVDWNDRPAWLIVAHDVTEKRRDQRALELRTQAMEASHNGMFICDARDPRRPICYINAAMARFCGQPRETMAGRPLADLFASEASHAMSRRMHALQAGRSAHAVVAARGHSDDTPCWLEAQVTPVADEAGATAYWIGVVQDITERKRFEARLAYRAHHDKLTELPNRDLLRQRLDQAVQSAAAAGEQVGVLFLDMDGFKQINDSSGHAAGDVYLQTMARRLANRIRSGDTLARIGGDEFVLVTSGVDLATGLPQMAARMQAAFAEPVSINGHAVSACCSIGIASYPAHGHDAETLLRRADLTMYMAKRNGGHSIEWFTMAMETEFRQRAALEGALQQALAQHEFELHYQPQMDMAENTVVGLEALLRWPSADEAYRRPDQFIPIAEETGLIVPIGTWVLQRACADLATLRGRGHRTLSMAVNVSAIQLRQAGFADIVADALDRHGLPAEALEIEITESVFMTDADQTAAVLHTLQDMGVRLAIDDFGTGYSSLSYLSRLPVDRLKIDRSFIHDMNTSEPAGELVRQVASMARSLHLEPVAEGVETEAELQALLGYECTLGQGFHFSRALPIAELPALLGSEKPASPVAAAS